MFSGVDERGWQRTSADGSGRPRERLHTLWAASAAQASCRMHLDGRGEVVGVRGPTGSSCVAWTKAEGSNRLSAAAGCCMHWGWPVGRWACEGREPEPNRASECVLHSADESRRPRWAADNPESMKTLSGPYLPLRWAVVRTGMASGEVGVVAGGSGGSASRREREQCEQEAAGGSGSGGGPCWGARTKVVGDGGRPCGLPPALRWAVEMEVGLGE